MFRSREDFVEHIKYSGLLVEQVVGGIKKVKPKALVDILRDKISTEDRIRFQALNIKFNQAGLGEPYYIRHERVNPNDLALVLDYFLNPASNFYCGDSPKSRM